MTYLLYEKDTYDIIGACFEVYNEMVCGFTEAFYQECLEIELEQRKIPFQKQKQIDLFYKGKKLKQKFLPDFICHEKIILEMKAISNLCDEHYSQVLNYLNATGMKLGLLINFGHYTKLEKKRIILTEDDKKRYHPKDNADDPDERNKKQEK